jgi:RND family efflux transporter MFP subunit
MDAEIYADGYPGITFKGMVNTIVVEADPLTLTFPVEIMVVNNRPEKLLPGFICRVKLRGKVFKQSIFLPREVVLRRDGQSVVFVAAGDTVSARIVETGFTNRGKILIKKGIKPGDRIVLVGQEALQDGTRIRIR